MKFVTWKLLTDGLTTVHASFNSSMPQNKAKEELRVKID